MLPQPVHSTIKKQGLPKLLIISLANINFFKAKYIVGKSPNLWSRTRVSAHAFNSIFGLKTFCSPSSSIIVFGSPILQQLKSIGCMVSSFFIVQFHLALKIDANRSSFAISSPVMFTINGSLLLMVLLHAFPCFNKKTIWVN